MHGPWDLANRYCVSDTHGHAQLSVASTIYYLSDREAVQDIVD